MIIPRNYIVLSLLFDIFAIKNVGYLTNNIKYLTFYFTVKLLLCQSMDFLFFMLPYFSIFV